MMYYSLMVLVRERCGSLHCPLDNLVTGMLISLINAHLRVSYDRLHLIHVL